jgi:hypothetical protein
LCCTYQLVHHVKPQMDISIYNGIIVSRILDKDIVNVSLADNLLKIFVLWQMYSILAFSLYC